MHPTTENTHTLTQILVHSTAFAVQSLHAALMMSAAEQRALLHEIWQLAKANDASAMQADAAHHFCNNTYCII